MFNRRNFLASSTGLILAAGAARAQQTAKKRIAFLGTAVYTHSHAQHFLDRLTQGYAWHGRWQAPRVDVASVYIDQFPDRDLAKGRIAKHQLRQASSVREALTLGGTTLAVDGVVIIGEHGDYSKNEKGQTLYPRYKWFKEMVKIFEESHRAVPVFNDKHLSTNWDECVEMVADAKRLGFPLLAGSSLPVTWRLPSIEMPLDADLKESVCVAYGRVDSYDFHAFETAQCMSERRRGGEVGIRSVHALRGEKLWQVLDSDDRRRTRELLVAALTCSHNLPVETGYPTAAVSYEWVKRTLPETLGFLVEHRDGFRTAAFLTAIRDFNYAGSLGQGQDIFTCQMYLPMPNQSATTADFFNPLTRHIEDVILTGKTPYPVERTLLTSGMVIAGVDSLHAGQIRRETPEMAVAYKAPPDSSFWRR